MTKHCMFQYATSYNYMNTKIYEDTGLITWKEALGLWNKYKSQVIRELQDDISHPEMVIWTGCEDDTDYRNDSFHVYPNTQVQNNDFVEVVTKIINPNTVTMGEPAEAQS